MRQRHRHLGGDADVLGDAAIGVVVVAGGELQPVQVAVRQPVVEQQRGQPAPPVELDPALDVQVEGGHAHGQCEDEREHRDQVQQLGQRAFLEGIEEVAVPVADPDHQPDLGDRQRHQQQHRSAHLPLALAVPVRPRQAHEAPPAGAAWRVGGRARPGGSARCGGHERIMPCRGPRVRGGRRARADCVGGRAREQREWRPHAARRKRERGLHRCKPLNLLVVMGGIEPPTYGL